MKFLALKLQYKQMNKPVLFLVSSSEVHDGPFRWKEVGSKVAGAWAKRRSVHVLLRTPELSPGRGLIVESESVVRPRRQGRKFEVERLDGVSGGIGSCIDAAGSFVPTWRGGIEGVVTYRLWINQSLEAIIDFQRPYLCKATMPTILKLRRSAL